MIITLNKLADQLAADMNRSNDFKLKARLIDLISQEYATILKQTVDKNGYSESLISSVYIPLERSMTLPLEITRKRILYVTKLKIKQPLRTSLAPQPFTFVGSYDGVVSFIPSSFELISYNDNLPFISESIKYVYSNNLIYVLSPTPIKKIKVSAIFADIQTVYEPVSNSKDTIFNISSSEVHLVNRYDVELDIPLDILNLIKHKLLSEELRLQEQIQMKQIISDVDNN